jgi:WD40 repeat protein
MVLRGHEQRIGCVGFSPDGKRITSGSLDTTVRVWDAATGAELMTLSGNDAESSCSPDYRVDSYLWDGSLCFFALPCNV